MTRLRPFAAGIQQCHAQYHHRRHGSFGVFWAGRYDSKPVEIGEYLGRCGRYIERNPLRAGMVDVPWEYQWSSAAFYVRGTPDGLTDANMHAAASRMTQRDRQRYGRMLMSTEDDEWMEAHRHRRVIGSDTFAESIKRTGSRQRRKSGRRR